MTCPSHWFRKQELDRPEKDHPITTVAPSVCDCCGAVMRTVDDGRNSWICSSCGKWLAQIRPV